MVKKSNWCFLLTLVLGMILTGCSSKPPSVESVEEHFQNNYDDIQIVVEFMSNSGYNSIYIKGIDGMMLADLEDVPITDESVFDAVKRLLGTPLTGNRQYYYVSKSSNTIEFYQWKGTAEIGCGIAYTINGTDIPDVQYATELVQLSEPGWYYYVDDYNAWRTGKRPQLAN